MKQPLLSVCLITYNQTKYIKKAVDSILAQKVDFDWELVIADDCSTDGTRQIVQDYQKQHPDLIKLILQKKNVGPESNWLDLMNYPKSKYMAYIEGDDYWTDPHKLQQQVDFLQNNPKYVMSFHPVKVLFENDQGQSVVWPNLSGTTELAVSELLKENSIPSNSIVFRRQNYDKFPRGIMPGDWFFHLYNAKFGKIGFIDKVMSVYRKHDGGLWWANDTDKSLLWEKYGLLMFAFHSELLKLYGEDKIYRDIIYKSIRRSLKELVEVDEQKHVDLVKQAVVMFPEVASNLLTEHVADRQRLEDQEIQIEELNNELVTVRAQAYEFRDKLHALTHARLLGKIIKLRDSIGKFRKVFSVRFILHQARVVVAPLVPGPVRKFAKRVYRKIRHELRANLEPAQQLRTVANQAWPKSLPLVSVVIPYYNRGDTIDDTLESLQGQTFTNFEVIIVDDGSTEPSSIEKLQAIKDSGFKARFVDQPNKGVAAARNNGINKAKGKYIICLDSDDVLTSTFIEKCTILLEADPDAALVTTHMEVFGVVNEVHRNHEYDAQELYTNNMVITGAQFRKKAWEKSGGYKSGIGYEDWEFWLNLSEHGFWGRLIPEAIFKYRTSMRSRYIEDKDVHWNNLKAIRQLHSEHKRIIKKLFSQKRQIRTLVEPDTALINLRDSANYRKSDAKAKILVTVPWMTFGGAETLIYNYCREIRDRYNISFVTGLKSEHEWEYKFKEITPNIYHLANLFEDQKLYLEFISNYIETREIDALHIIHNGFTFDMLPELKIRHPKLKVCVTMFNDRVEYFEQSTKFDNYIDTFVTDNQAVARHYKQELSPGKDVRVIPNGVDCYDKFNLALFDRPQQRSELGIGSKDIAVFFVGRMSEEKNPDVFVAAAKKIISGDDTKNIKFIMVGDGPMGKEVQAEIKSIGSDNIQFIGYQADIPKYLSAADILVLPSSVEGFPLSILEAMAMRVVVIASRVGAIPDIIIEGEDGYIVTPGSVDEIATTIKTITASASGLEKVKQNARNRLEEKYSTRILGNNYRHLYDDLVK